MEYDFYTADVFTNTAFEGAQIAVIPHAIGLKNGLMQRIANEFNLSETVFVFPSNKKSATHRMKIFSSSGEIDFAGHPIIATAFVLVSIGEISLSAGHTEFVLEQNNGPITVNVSEEKDKPLLTQFTLNPESIVDRFVPRDQEIADFLSLDIKDIETKKYQAMMVSCSNSKCEIESLSKKALDKSIRCLYNAMGKYNWNARAHEFSLSARTTTIDFQSAC